MPFTNKKQNRLILFVVDIGAVCLAWITYYFLRVQSGLFETITEPEFTIPMFVVAFYWVLLFMIFGLYRPWYAQSRFDEFTLLFKAVTFGVLILFFLIFVDDTITNDPSTSRFKILIYWALLLLFLGVGRIAFRSLRRRMLIAGIGLRNTVLLGPDANSADLYRTISQFPALGYRIGGFLTTDGNAAQCAGEGLAVLGGADDIEQIIETNNVEEIIITLDSTEHERLLDLIGRCGAFRVGIKMRPDLYDIISGQARTNQIYGIPLIEVTPQLMAPWEAFIKRALDIMVSLIVVVLGLPLFLLIGIAQKISSRGPILYKQERVGKDGRTFMILKFRTMFVDAEKKTGPKWASKDDPRVTTLGRFLRKSHLDELPQVFNVLDGDMSLVGPRPERPFFVEQFIKEIPLYRRRLNVRPGITGWAQVKHTYDQSIEDVRAKLRYDLFYIENMSLRMDLKIILSTAYNMVAGRGHT
jgi:exopolysaccharide biosynthesis polyprenyl glycosylphosphotransferase